MTVHFYSSHSSRFHPDLNFAHLFKRIGGINPDLHTVNQAPCRTQHSFVPCFIADQRSTFSHPVANGVFEFNFRKKLLNICTHWCTANPNFKKPASESFNELLSNLIEQNFVHSGFSEELSSPVFQWLAIFSFYRFSQ